MSTPNLGNVRITDFVVLPVEPLELHARITDTNIRTTDDGAWTIFELDAEHAEKGLPNPLPLSIIMPAEYFEVGFDKNSLTGKARTAYNIRVGQLTQLFRNAGVESDPQDTLADAFEALIGREVGIKTKPGFKDPSRHELSSTYQLTNGKDVNA